MKRLLRLLHSADPELVRDRDRTRERLREELDRMCALSKKAEELAESQEVRVEQRKPSAEIVRGS